MKKLLLVFLGMLGISSVIFGLKEKKIGLDQLLRQEESDKALDMLEKTLPKTALEKLEKDIKGLVQNKDYTPSLKDLKQLQLTLETSLLEVQKAVTVAKGITPELTKDFSDREKEIKAKQQARDCHVNTKEEEIEEKICSKNAFEVLQKNVSTLKTKEVIPLNDLKELAKNLSISIEDIEYPIERAKKELQKLVNPATALETRFEEIVLESYNTVTDELKKEKSKKEAQRKKKQTKTVLAINFEMQLKKIFYKVVEKLKTEKLDEQMKEFVTKFEEFEKKLLIPKTCLNNQVKNYVDTIKNNSEWPHSKALLDTACRGGFVRIPTPLKPYALKCAKCEVKLFNIHEWTQVQLYHKANCPLYKPDNTLTKKNVMTHFYRYLLALSDSDAKLLQNLFCYSTNTLKALLDAVSYQGKVG